MTSFILELYFGESAERSYYSESRKYCATDARYIGNTISLTLEWKPISSVETAAAFVRLSLNRMWNLAIHRRRVLTGDLSKRAACRECGVHWQTLEKIVSHSGPPGYQQTTRRSSKRVPFVPIIEEILKSDRQVHRPSDLLPPHSPFHSRSQLPGKHTVLSHRIEQF